MRHLTPRLCLLIILFSALPLLSAPHPSGDEGLASRPDAFDNDSIRLAISPDCVSSWQRSKKSSYETNAGVNWSKMQWVTILPCRCNLVSSGLLGSFSTVVVFGDSVSVPLIFP